MSSLFRRKFVSYWAGCRLCFVVDLVEEHVGEGGSRSSWPSHKHESSQVVSQQNVAIRVFWSQCQARWALIARDLERDLRHGKQRVSTFYHDLFCLQRWSSCCHQMNVFVWHLARDLRHGKQRVSVVSWFGFGFGWFDWELLACWTTGPYGRWATSEPNSFMQSCFKEIFGGGRGDAYTFSYMTSSVSIRTTFGIQ